MEPKQVFGSLPEGYLEKTVARYCSRCGSACEQWRERLPHTICSACGHMQFVNPSPSVAVVVVDGGRVLLGRRRRGTGWDEGWCLPSGHIEFDEDFLTAGLRETLEETGIEVEIQGVLSVVSNFWEHADSTLVVVLLARPLVGDPSANPEMSEVAWFSSNALPELAFEADAHVIELFFKRRFGGAPVDPAFARLQDRDPSYVPPRQRRFLQ